MADDHRGNATIAAGDLHSLAVRTDGMVYAWGDNASGQLGDGTQTQRDSPVLATNLTNIVAVSGGGFLLDASWATEGFSLGLRADGLVMSWGVNSYGQLGDGTQNNSSSPLLNTNLTNIIAVAAGGYHTLALASDGTIKAWGRGNYGEIGDGGTSMRTSPVAVTNLTNIIAIAAGATHSVALKSDGSVWVWGDNEFYQLGDGATTNNLTH